MGTLINWSRGDLNPTKCSWTMHDYQSDGKGGWHYTDQQRDHDDPNELEDLEQQLEEVTITVPTNNSDAEMIKHLQLTEAVKNLGLFTRPDGNNQPHLDQLKKRMEDWTTLVKQGSLPTRSVWTSYTHQL